MQPLRGLASLALAAALLVTAGPARAAFHLMKVVEVFPGTTAAPAAQYVVLQMYAAGQNFVGGHSVFVFDASGLPVGAATFPGNVANGANQAKLLIATPEAQTLFGVTADLAMTASLPLAGGKVCFDVFDCVAWGGYAPTGGDPAVGTPFPDGLRPGEAIVRRLDIAGGAATLDAGDDTDDSAADWAVALPAPRNNAGQLGVVPPSACGNGVIEGLEQCDDGNPTPGDGCEDCKLTPEPGGVAATAAALAALFALRRRTRALRPAAPSLPAPAPPGRSPRGSRTGRRAARPPPC
jgi:cysteine-rich repeat protein